MVITSGSSVGIEAISLNIPSITIAKCYYDSVIDGINFCESPKKPIKCLEQESLQEKIDNKAAYVYGAWAMRYGSDFKYFHQSDYGFGYMTDGSRIASAGKVQKLASLMKKIAKKRFQ